VTDIRELLRRVQLDEPDRRIARDLGISRNTVARYRQWATEQKLLLGTLPEPAALAALLQPAPAERPAHEHSLVEPFRDQVKTLHEGGVEGQAIWQLLVEQHDFAGSYSSLKRFVRRLDPGEPRATLRLEVDPGTEAQVDFGFAGPLLDPEHDRVRRAWVFVMTLSCSRHQYAEIVFEQTIDTWLRLHRAAFDFFGGVPRRVVLDNLRAAIVHAALYDPEVQRSYREFAEHYGFLIAPCRPRTPEHKGKVEQGGVHYVKRNALAGRAFRDVHEANRCVIALRRPASDIARLRHGDRAHRRDHRPPEGVCVDYPPEKAAQMILGG
jgi:transposase